MDSHALRNFKDFLIQYNKISEDCFKDCVYDLTSRDLTVAEETCVDRCSYKHVKMNNRAMQVYMEIQPEMTQRRIDELNKQAVAAAPTLPDATSTPDAVAASSTPRAHDAMTEIEAAQVAIEDTSNSSTVTSTT